VASCRTFLESNLPKGWKPEQVESNVIAEPEVSGETADRPGIDQVWAGIEAKRWHLIIAEESSRLYRHHTKAGDLFESAVHADVRVICTSDSIDTADDDWSDRPHMSQIQHARSNFYTRKRIERAHDRLWARGAAVGRQGRQCDLRLDRVFDLERPGHRREVVAQFGLPLENRRGALREHLGQRGIPGKLPPRADRIGDQHRTPLGPGRKRKSTQTGASGVIELAPFEFLDRFADLIPQPRKHRHRYDGVFAPNHTLRRAVTALAIGNVGKQREAATGGHAGDGHAAGGCCDANQKPRSHDTSRIAWAKLMARVGEEFPLECPACGGDIRLRGDGRQEPAHLEPEVHKRKKNRMASRA
jgi:hypothetical protein